MRYNIRKENSDIFEFELRRKKLIGRQMDDKYIYRDRPGDDRAQRKA